MTRKIILNAFDMTSAMHNSHGLWKHPDNKRTRNYKDLDYWLDLAKLLERGKFDAIFFADVYGVYDVYEQRKDPAVRNGLQIPLNDPAFVVPAMASVTENLSFALTVSTTYDHPFANARRFSTLDHLTEGRIAWNIVTSYLPNAARNFGLEKMLRHDERYEVADEFLDVSYKLWELSWEDGAIINDVENEVFADPGKIHEIDHQGSYFRVQGPHLSEPSPQRTPVIYQAGSSERGREFAAKHAECVFIGGRNPEKIQFYIKDIKKRAEKYGRNPNHIKTFTFLNVIVAETSKEAHQKYEEYNKLWSPDAAKALFGGGSGYDLNQYTDIHSNFTYRHTEHGQTSASLYTKDVKNQLKIKDVLKRMESMDSNHIVVGNPTEVADTIQYLFEEIGVDGFNLAHLISPASLEEFIELVVPELQKRGIYKTKYKDGTLREKLFSGSNQLPNDHPAKVLREKFLTSKQPNGL